MKARMRIDNCTAKATHGTVANHTPRPLVDPALALCNAATIIRDGMPAEIVAKGLAGWKELSGHHRRRIAENINRGSTPLSIGMLSKLFQFSADMGR